MNEREQIINFLLQACDAKNQQITALQTQNTELQKRLAQYETTSAAQVPVPGPTLVDVAATA